MVTPKPLNWVAALERLHGAGLECECVPGKSLYILGGAVRINDEIIGFEKPFAIFEEPCGLLAIVSECKPYWDEQCTVDDLEQAVNAVIKIYQQRGMLRNE